MPSWSAARSLTRHPPSSETYRVAPATPVRSTSDRRAVIATRLRDLAEELHDASTDADALRLAADIVRALPLPVEHFDGEEIRNDRGEWIGAMVGSLNFLARKWVAEKRWWLSAAERERLALAEAERHELARPGGCTGEGRNVWRP